MTCFFQKVIFNSWMISVHYNMTKKKLIRVFLILVFTFSTLLFRSAGTVSAAAFTTFSLRPSRMQTSQLDVNFLVKASPVTTATEDGVRIVFATGYAVDSTPANITVTTTGIASWDSACANAWPGIGSAATGVSGQTVDFASSDLTVSTVYCFIITAGIDNPGSVGNYAITLSTRASAADVDTGTMSLPIVDDDTVAITASITSFVRCDVTTTTGGDNAVALGTLTYGSVTSSSDDIQISGGTNATEGMVWFYRSDTPNNGLYSTGQTHLLDGASAEDTISATTADCTATDPCFGIYYNGTSSAGSGTFVSDTNFTGGSVTTSVGPLTTEIYGESIANSNSLPASQITADYNINATAAENSPVASDYAETLIFTCKADL